MTTASPHDGESLVGVPVFGNSRVTVANGDCVEVLRALPDGSVDAVVTDPPYGVQIENHAWDNFQSAASGGTAEDVAEGRAQANLHFQAWVTEWAAECFRVLKPGGHLLAFGAARTFHRLAAGIEDAGFEIRDGINWVYVSGAPKSMDVSKALDKQAGRQGESIDALKVLLQEVFDASGLTRLEWDRACGFRASGYLTRQKPGSKPNPWVRVLPTSEKWRVMRDTLALPTAYDPVLARLDAAFTEAEREVVGKGRAGLSRGRITSFEKSSTEFDITAPATKLAQDWAGWGTSLKPMYEPIVVARKPLDTSVAVNVAAYGVGAINVDGSRVPWLSEKDAKAGAHPGGKWPPNMLLTHSEECDPDSECVPECPVSDLSAVLPKPAENYMPVFRYQPKAGRSERVESSAGEFHPSVKPLELMRWLVRLVTPADGLVLDPFAGSGTTAEACLLEGFRCYTIEREAAYLPLIAERVRRAELAVEQDGDTSQ